jgi:hypothetical protein
LILSMRERQRSLLVPDKRTVAETDTERAGLTHDLACEWDWGWRGEVVHA